MTEAPKPGGLNVEGLRADAASRSTTSDWGDNDGFVDNLRLLIESSRSAGLTPKGWDVLGRVAMRHLRNRLAIQAYLTEQPALHGLRMAKPIVITGLPRTGTTLLHHLMALDPKLRVLQFWEALRPAPPAESPGARDDRLAQAGRWLDRFYELAPEFRAIHHRTADGPEECDALLQNTFASQHFDDMFGACDYSRWLGTAGLHDEYADYLLQLKVLAGGDPGTGARVNGVAGRRWVLKSPSHLGHIDALLGVMPDAVVVQCHREPTVAVASHAGLVLALRRIYGREADPAHVASRVLHGAALAMERALQVRAAGAHRFVDVSYPELEASPIKAITSVYERLGRTMEPSLVTRIEGWSAENPRYKHGTHRYDPARFGISESRVHERFESYLATFGELVEGDARRG